MERRPVRPKSVPHKGLGRDDLDGLAAQALGFLAADDDRLGRFFAASGVGPDSLRSAAGVPGFAANLLDYLASDEALFRDFADAIGRHPADLDAMRISLSGDQG